MTVHFQTLPSPLQERANHHWQRFTEHNTELAEQLVPYEAHFLTAFALSDFISDSCISLPSMTLRLMQSGDLSLGQRQQKMKVELSSLLSQVEDEQSLWQTLREFRRYQMVVIAWRELTGQSSVEESLDHLSFLAYDFIELTLEYLFKQQCQRLGTPKNEAGDIQKMLVLAMGKLGGGELNYSSDIDLIFTFPENGKTEGGRRSIGNQEFFIKLGQKLVQALNQTTAHGFVYRVDMRLRPFGNAGPLVISFAALEDYYQHQGREWERFAMVKAKPLAGTPEARLELQELLRPFIYRRYVDYSAIDSLRSMKAMINAEVRRKGLVDNIKLGAGGIREVEFVAQAFQLIRGGKEPDLRVRGLLSALDVLVKLGSLPVKTGAVLKTAYLFLRKVENRLQQFSDKQTQTLPDNDIDKQRLVVTMGFDTWPAFYHALQQQLQVVHGEFLLAIGDEPEQHKSKVRPIYHDLWQCQEQGDLQQLLDELNLPVQEFSPLLIHFKQEMEKRASGPRGRESIEVLLPILLEKVLSLPEPLRLLQRVFHLLEAIASRTPYIELLVENLGALQQLLTLLSGSAFITEQLALHPLLLDELLDPTHLYHPVEPQEYNSELRQFMLRIDEEDMEQQMEGLRQFKQLQMLRVAAADVAKVLPLMEVSNHLTAVAEAILAYSVELAWQQMSEKFGIPNDLIDESERHFAVIGYGKMGGTELSYSSDLDLVFLHNCQNNAKTIGSKVISGREFYLKLAQRLMHLFNTKMPSGILYELDLRLRPSGSSGLMVASLESFEQYQQEKAWTWEHQALARARCCYGSVEMSQKFAEIRKRILCRPREITELKRDIVQMRSKMRAHLLRGNGDAFDLKQSPGGMVDIEFIAQFLVLAYSAEYAHICRYSDNIHIFEQSVELNLLSIEQGKQLIDAYIRIRDESNRLTMQKQTRLLGADELQQERQQVMAIWQQLLE